MPLNCVFATVPTQGLAAMAVQHLSRAGFKPDEVAVLFPDGKIPAGFAQARLPTSAVQAASDGGDSGGLLAMGIPASEIERYRLSVAGGRVLISARAHGSSAINRATRIFELLGAADIGNGATAPKSEPAIAWASTGRFT